jgi:hypothetical protein
MTNLLHPIKQKADAPKIEELNLKSSRNKGLKGKRLKVKLTQAFLLSANKKSR